MNMKNEQLLYKKLGSMKKGMQANKYCVYSYSQYMST